MDSTQVKQIAEEIFNQHSLQHWQIDLALLVLWVASTTFSAFAGSYFGRRGENKANAADLGLLKKQIGETTTVAESIKVNLQSLSGRILKIEDLKREKLEKYLVALEESVNYETALMQHHFFGDERPKGISPTSTAIMLQNLYLPEIEKEHQEFIQAISKFRDWVADGLNEQLENLRKTQKKGPPSFEHTKQHQPLNSAINQKLSAIYTKTREISKTFMT